MSDQSLDIIAINETKLDQSISDAQLHIDDYTLLRKDRTRQGGGVAFYIRNTICYIECLLKAYPFIVKAKAT